MPPVRPQENPYKPGDWVTMAQGNGAGEGILWRVNKVDGSWIKIEPAWAVTGRSVLRPKRVQYFQVDAADIVQLGSAFQQLSNIIRDIAISRGMDRE